MSQKKRTRTAQRDLVRVIASTTEVLWTVMGEGWGLKLDVAVRDAGLEATHAAYHLDMLASCIRQIGAVSGEATE